MPQLEVIFSLRRIYGWNGASKFTTAVDVVFIALPWWLYGYMLELVVKHIAAAMKMPDEV